MAIVWLAAYPRSGVTFLRHVLERVYGVKTLTLYDETRDVSKVFSEDRTYTHALGDTMDTCFVKTHWTESACMPWPAIHLVRDPFDTMVSYAHFERDIRDVEQPVEDILQAIVGGDVDAGMWGLHLLAWLGRPAVRMTFESLVRSPIPTVTKAVEALQLPLEPNHKAALDGFSVLQDRAPKFFRSGKTGTGRAAMSDELVRLFEQLQGWAHQRYKSVFCKDAADGNDTLQRASADGSANG